MKFRLFCKKKDDSESNRKADETTSQFIKDINDDLEETQTKVDFLEELIRTDSFTKIMLVEPGKAEKEKSDGCDPCSVCG